MNLRPAIRCLLRPVVLGALVALACAAWHFRPLSREVLIRVQFRNGDWGFINEAGRIAIASSSWDFAETFDAHGMAAVWKKGVKGWIDRRGKLVIPIEWEYPIHFYFDRTLEDLFNPFGLIAVEKDRKWGWINRDGKVVIPPVLEIPIQPRNAPFLPFGDRSMAVVEKGRRTGVIDRAGDLVVACEWDCAEITKNPFGGHAIVTKTVDPKPFDQWIERAMKWLTGSVEDENPPEPIMCHVYDHTGRLIWRSDDAKRHLPLLVGVLAGGVAGLDGLRRLWRCWKGRAAVS